MLFGNLWDTSLKYYLCYVPGKVGQVRTTNLKPKSERNSFVWSVVSFELATALLAVENISIILIQFS